MAESVGARLKFADGQIAITMNLYAHVLPAMQKEVAARMDAILASSHPVATTAAAKASGEGELIREWFRIWWALKDLNLRPTDYESAALTAELRARAN